MVRVPPAGAARLRADRDGPRRQRGVAAPDRAPRSDGRVGALLRVPVGSPRRGSGGAPGAGAVRLEPRPHPPAARRRASPSRSCRSSPYGAKRRVALARTPVDPCDPFLCHKTTRRDVYTRAQAARPDVDDVILWNTRGEITEATIANVVVEIGGERWTPPRTCGLLPGIAPRPPRRRGRRPANASAEPRGDTPCWSALRGEIRRRIVRPGSDASASSCGIRSSVPNATLRARASWSSQSSARAAYAGRGDRRSRPPVHDAASRGCAETVGPDQSTPRAAQSRRAALVARVGQRAALVTRPNAAITDRRRRRRARASGLRRRRSESTTSRIRRQRASRRAAACASRRVARRRRVTSGQSCEAVSTTARASATSRSAQRRVMANDIGAGRARAVAAVRSAYSAGRSCQTATAASVRAAVAGTIHWRHPDDAVAADRAGDRRSDAG